MVQRHISLKDIEIQITAHENEFIEILPSKSAADIRDFVGRTSHFAQQCYAVTSQNSSVPYCNKQRFFALWGKSPLLYDAP